MIPLGRLRPQEQLRGARTCDAVTRDGFRIAHDISAYSLAALKAQAGRAIMASRKGAIVTI